MCVNTIYLDYASTTPPLPQVSDAVYQTLKESWGNASSLHAWGMQLRRKIELARLNVANLLECKANEIIFTSGGTESNQLAISSVLNACKQNQYPIRNEILISSVEHSSLLANVSMLEKNGWTVKILPVDRFGRVTPAILANAITKKTLLVSIQWVNNEVGTIHPIQELVKITHQAGALFHTDAVQAMLLPDVSVRRTQVDLLSLSGHKMYGPPGVGVLFVQQGTPFSPLFRGGKQERGKRPGTENAPSIIGLGEAANILLELRQKWAADTEIIREQLWQAIFKAIPNVERFTPDTNIHPGILSIGIPGIDGESLVVRLNKEAIAASSGAACHSGQKRSSHVLTAMGISDEKAREMLRLSIGFGFQKEFVKHVAFRLYQSVREFAFI